MIRQGAIPRYFHDKYGVSKFYCLDLAACHRCFYTLASRSGFCSTLLTIQPTTIGFQDGAVARLHRRREIRGCNACSTLVSPLVARTEEGRLTSRVETHMIHAVRLTKKFGDLTAVDQVSLDVEDGEVFGFLGPNGAGKTTMIRMLASLISKTSGTGEVAGCEIGKESDELRLRSRIGVLPESVGLYEGSSAYENLEYFGRLQRVDPATLRSNIERLLRMMDLWEKRDLPVATFSKGMKQKVAVARTLVHDPILLFLDEPTANLDPEAAKMVRDVILELKKEKRTIFLNTHHLDEAQRVCDRVGILRTRLLTVGSVDALRSGTSGKHTTVRLERATEEIAAAVRARLGNRQVQISGDRLIVEVTDPDRENPEIVAAVIGAGGRIREISQLSPSLEDVYLKLIREGTTAS
jgi:ABC-2 type transport system ATP-binding protein